MLSKVLTAIGGTITAKPTFSVTANGKTTLVPVDAKGLTYRINIGANVYWISTGSKIARKGAATTAAAYTALPTVSLEREPVLLKAAVYVHLNSFFNLIGGDTFNVSTTTVPATSPTTTLFATDKTRFVSAADVIDAKYLDSTKTLIIKATDIENEYFTVNTSSRIATKLNGISVQTSEFIVSPDATKAAFLDDNTQEVYVYTFATSTASKVLANTTEKVELEWTDNNTLFYILGSAQNQIAKVDISTGIQTIVVSDSVNYKSELNVSSDGKKLSWLVTPVVAPTYTGGASTPPTITEDAENLDFDVTTTTNGTEPQLYVFDADAAVPAAKKLTSTLDNKSFTTALSDGTSVFLSTDTVDEEAIPTLTIVKDGATISTRSLALANVELSNYVSFGTKLIVQGKYTEPGSSTSADYIYEIDHLKNRAKTLYTIPADAVSISLGNTNTSISYSTSDGKVFVRSNNAWTQIVK
jgi:hypothetical protein